MTLGTSIFKMLGPSPIKPLEQHIDIVRNCAEKLRPFLEHVREGNWQAAAEVQQEIADLESQADELKRDLRLSLPKGLFLPVARDDLLDCLTSQDRIANKTEDLAGLMLSRKMRIPDPVLENYTNLLDQTLEAVSLAHRAINELDELLETGFTEKVVHLVEHMIKRLHEIEHNTDEMQAQTRESLFKIEKELPAVDVIFLYKVIEWTGEIADRAQTVGERLQLLISN